MARYVIRIAGLVSGKASRYDGSYVKRFDFEDCEPGQSHLDTVADPAYALQFMDVEEARQFWMTVDRRDPVRPDGKPNRPLTAFSVTMEPVPDSDIDGSHREKIA